MTKNPFTKTTNPTFFGFQTISRFHSRIPLLKMLESPFNPSTVRSLMENKELEMSQDLGQGQEQEQELEAWSEDEDEEKKPVILSLSLQGLPFKKVNGLVFVDIQSLRNLTTTPGTEQGYQSILDSVNTILNEFNSVNARGYVSLKEHATFLPFLPVVKQFVTSFGLVDSHKSEVSYT